MDLDAYSQGGASDDRTSLIEDALDISTSPRHPDRMEREHTFKSVGVTS